jgi:feruloyl esterase
MVPPHASELHAMRKRGAKMVLYHGTSDPIFSSDDTSAWYEALRASQGGDASDFVRLFLVPGMNHCRGGPATDQFDMLTPLVDWVEKGVAPARAIAGARGLGNPGEINADVPADWSPARTRPLCPYPQVARYTGSGSLESADSFACRQP